MGGRGNSITDATSVPSDVTQGKIFYNNNGRQIGSSLGSIVTSTINIEPGAYSSTISAKAPDLYSAEFITSNSPMYMETNTSKNVAIGSYLMVIKEANIPIENLRMMWFEYSVRGALIPVTTPTHNRTYGSTNKYVVVCEATSN